MTLEDFFTLTEMKDGLTAPSRVHELIALMQKEKDCIVKNVGDATRQWAAVASTIAATENKDCLNLFIQLDGLGFIDRWLKDAQKFSNDTADGFIEESINTLLRALEKLQIDKGRSISSGIWITVNNLLDHSSTRVQDKARALFDSWKQGKVSDASHHDVHSVDAFRDANVLTSDNNRPECAGIDVPLSSGNAVVENTADEPSKDENLQSRSSNSLQSERADVQIQTHGSVKDRSPDSLTTSIMSTSIQESPPLIEKSSMGSVEGTASTVTHSFPIPRGQNTESELDASKKPSSVSENSGMVVSSSCKVERGASSSSGDVASAKEILREPVSQSNPNGKEGDFCPESTALSDARIAVSPTKAGKNDLGLINHSNVQLFKSTDKDDCSHDTLRKSSDSDRRSEKTEDVGILLSRIADIGTVNDDQGHSSDGAEDLGDDSDYSKPAMDTQSPDLTDRRRSEIELEYGIVDALEVARQVAQEVEREVVDYKEPSCSSSSEKIIGSGIRHPGSPDSINANQDPHTEVPQEDHPTGKNQSAEGYPEEDRHLTSSDNMEIEAENGLHELESSQVTEVAPDPEFNAEKGLCFDLNQEVCSDDMDHPVNPISTPVSVVSASRPTAASGSPSAPLQFEGILGWKGSAATSAFRPASPRKTTDGDKILETGGTSGSSKHRQDSLDIDLNVAEDGHEKVMDLISGTSIPVSSGLHSGESSLEMGPRRSERPNLDLNCISNDGDAPPSGLRMEALLLYPRNGHRSPSPASSSSSMQPSLRNFDLNDRPLFLNDSSDQGLYHGNQNTNAFGGSKSGDPVISIMGTRVEVGSRVEVSRKDIFPQNPSLPNGKPLDPAVDANVSRMGGVLGIPTVSYSHSPVFGYNGLTTVPAMSISSAVYGPGASIPFLDSRVPVVPQLLGSTSAVPPPYSQSSFIMSVTGAPVSLNGAGLSRPSIDLNSGFAIEGGNGGLRQLFMPSQGRPMEEHLKATVQPSSSSGVGGKRREPDSGWEPCSLQYKHPQPPWR